ncbi:uncharacterized protein PGTG_16853 [Puccinia graminis f. sp. tritici CRL 75-36-700-3]|uniref:Uncharacterized protein n=1 Tax=Puccinia graminis f. sp. tritici (strain CRL 75-36-700-3 / race SCCL) TaxID=418459 RepID=E3L2J4_PUCGT|nr:uncharacterized protein PGTG_16853 [Puccinia graminis f. sp. tritici CRL 75-36-700-3]EFP90827.2 hypothetical protein PGTG_16853 [Puccinia graminis f. sp. tritici CRL 75-36-700-3]
MSHYSIPGFRREETAAKTSAVRMSLGNPPTTAIQQALGPTISIESYHRSVQLYHTTRRALRDPEEFIRETTQESLSDDEREFMVELVRLEPTLFFDKIMERFYDCNGVVPMDDMYSLQELLVQELCVTLDKTRPANNRKSLEKKYQYIARITKHPANFLVFMKLRYASQIVEHSMELDKPQWPPTKVKPESKRVPSHLFWLSANPDSSS